MPGLRLVLAVGLSLILHGRLLADEPTQADSKQVAKASSLAYLDECNPWYPHKDFPKLITPQWVGEEGVEAVIVLAIDDMRDPAKYEQYLRPILNRLKQIDGRAPVSIMTNEVKPDDAQLQSWLGEGLSIECHTIDHPCPILQGGDFAKAKSTYDRCVDLMGTIPGNKPVAFRTPCCDSLNTVSPRFFSEIFSSTTEKGNFLQIDSSVFTFFTSEDESLPKELVLDANGKERFWKYLPKNNKYGGNTHDNFVNYIKNYPYPYVINNSCWEIPCIAPSDWSAQHLHGINNPVTIEDWKAAIDLTVHKQGCFSLVFHPHGWIKPEQVVEMIDHAVAKHGNKVKFLNFREVAERLNKNLLHDEPIRRTSEWRLPVGADNSVRIVDLDANGFMDVWGSEETWAWDTASTSWFTHETPVPAISPGIGHSIFVGRGLLARACMNSTRMIYLLDGQSAWRFPNAEDGWEKEKALAGAMKEKYWCAMGLGVRVYDINCDGTDEFLTAETGSFEFRGGLLEKFNTGLPEEFHRPFKRTCEDFFADNEGIHFDLDNDGSNDWTLPKEIRDVIFCDVDSDGFKDLIRVDGRISFYDQSSRQWCSALIDLPATLKQESTFSPAAGFFIHDNHFCWINEDTAKLPDLMYRVSFDEVLKASGRASALRDHAPPEPRKQDGDSAAEQRQPIAPGVSPGNDVPNDQKAPEGRHNSDGDDQSAAPSGLEHSSSTAPPSSHPGLSAIVAPRLNRNGQEGQDQHGGLTPNRSPEYSAVPIGAAVVDITPDYPVRLTGYGNRLKESEGVAVKIHARALVIGRSPTSDSAAEQRQPIAPSSTDTPGSRPGQSAAVAPRLNGSGPESPPAASTPSSGLPATFSPDLGGEGTLDAQLLAILVTVDNCGVPLEMTEAIYERIAAKYNIPRQNFAISSTHSHSAPWLRGFAPNIFAEIPEDHAAHLAQYEKDLTDKLVDVIEKAIARQRPGHLSYGFGEAGFAMNRRALANGKWSGFGEVPDGPTDKRVPVLAAHDVEGKLIAVLANYACHCTTETGEFNQISGDWAGFAADMLEADHPGAVALIAIGCGADANPSPRGTHEQAKSHGRTLADEVTRILASGRASALRDRAQLSPLPRAGEGQGEGAASNDLAASIASNPLIRPSATFSPDLGGEGTMRGINPDILCNMARIDLPLGPIPTREIWEQQAKNAGVEGSRARYFLQMLDEGKPIPTTIPNYPVQTWCFGDDLAMVFLGGEVVVDYSIRMNDMFDSDRLWINAYSNDVPCYIASARILREGGYECDSSMLYYRRPTRLAPEAEDVLCDAVQKIMPHKFYSEKLQQDFPAPKSPEESLKCMTTKPDLRVVLAASEPLIRDPVAFDWDERGRLWVVEMGDYPNGDSSASGRASALRVDAPDAAQTEEEQNAHGGLTPNRSPDHRGRVQVLEDTDKNGVYDKATTFLDNLAFPNGIHCWRGGVIITMAPEIFYAEDTDGDGKADVRETMYRGFVEGNQQHRVNGLRWGLDGWLYLANGDSGGEIAGTGFVPGQNLSPLPRAGGEGQGEGAAANDQAASSASNPLIRPSATFSPGLGGEGTRLQRSVSLRGRDLRINPDTNELDAVSGQTQFGRERDDFGNWFGNNNSNPIYQYLLEDQYVRRNPHAKISQVTAQVSVIPGAAPVYPTSRTLARFNDFAYANRFTSACSTMIYRDTYLGEQYYGNAFTSEPVHNLVSRMVMTRDGYGFKGERAPDEQQSEFLASSDNWFRPTMIRTGPDGAIWVADMYRAVIEHPEWIPPEYQRKMNLYAGSDMGRIYRIVPASECCGETHGDSAAEQLQPIAPGVSPGNEPPNDEKAPEGRHNSDGDDQSAAPVGLDDSLSTETPGSRPGLQTVVAPRLNPNEQQEQNSHGGLTPNRSPSREVSYFEQPWNEIPIKALVKRLECPNGWWRDTAQRILVHRLDEWNKVGNTKLDWRLVEVLFGDSPPQVRVQAAAFLYLATRSYNMQPGMLQPFSAHLQNDPHPEVRRYAVKLLEPTLCQGQVNKHALEILSNLAQDSDMRVRLQVLLSLGECPDDSAADLLAKAFRDSMTDETLRAAAYSSLTEKNIRRTLIANLEAPSGALNEQLILMLVGQAAEFGQTSEIGRPLKTLMASIDQNSNVDRYTVVHALLMQMSNSEAMKDLRNDTEFTASIAKAVEASLRTARNAEVEEQIRGLALTFSDTAMRIVGQDQIVLTEFMSPQMPLTVQKAATTILALRSDETSMSQLIQLWPTLTPELRHGVIEIAESREAAVALLLSAKETITSQDFNAAQRDLLLNHRSEKVSKLAKELFGQDHLTARAAVVADFKSQVSNLKSEISKDEQAAAGKLVFEKRCATCHRLQDIGKEVGADLAALKDRSTDALLTAILDPNKAVESKFLVYTVVTKDGLQHSRMLKGETGGSLTLIGSDGKEITVSRAEIDELIGTQRSLMPEGLEKDLSAVDLANVMAFVQSTGTAWKRFDGNLPQVVKPNDDGTITLPASAAEIYGPNLVFEPKYGNLGFWTSAEDYAKWTFDVPVSGHWTVELDFACDDSTAGSLMKFSTGNRMLTARVPGSGTWDNYQTYRAGTIDIHRGRGQLIITAPEKPAFALIDLRAVRLIPPE